MTFTITTWCVINPIWQTPQLVKFTLMKCLQKRNPTNRTIDILRTFYILHIHTLKNSLNDIHLWWCTMNIHSRYVPTRGRFCHQMDRTFLPMTALWGTQLAARSCRLTLRCWYLRVELTLGIELISRNWVDTRNWVYLGADISEFSWYLGADIYVSRNWTDTSELSSH
jgi:hypothetical protein